MNSLTVWLARYIAAVICVMISALGITGADSGEGRGENSELGEEDSARYALDETYDTIRAGARLLLAYDAESGSFYGLAQNTTEETLRQVRVEVHLSNGMELGPTAPMDLEPGEVACVLLPATEEPFDAWSPHAEVGLSSSGEHDSGGERVEVD